MFNVETCGTSENQSNLELPATAYSDWHLFSGIAKQWRSGLKFNSEGLAMQTMLAIIISVTLIYRCQYITNPNNALL